jgi:hypothetical protein
MIKDKVTQFVLKLIKLTKNKEITWKGFIPLDTDLPNEEVILDKIYKTTVSDKQLHLYRYKFKYFIDEYEYQWVQKVRLELIDSKGETDYVFKYENSMNDLYDIVREQASNVNQLIDDILSIE